MRDLKSVLRDVGHIPSRTLLGAGIVSFSLTYPRDCVDLVKQVRAGVDPGQQPPLQRPIEGAIATGLLLSLSLSARVAEQWAARDSERDVEEAQD